MVWNLRSEESLPNYVCNTPRLSLTSIGMVSTGDSYLIRAPRFRGVRRAHTRNRQTDSFNWDTNPHTPRLYFKLS